MGNPRRDDYPRRGGKTALFHQHPICRARCADYLAAAYYREAFFAGDIEINAAITRDTLQDDRRSYLFAQGNFDLGRDYKLKFDIEATSDDAYLLDYGYSEKDRLDSAIKILRVRDTGIGDDTTYSDGLRVVPFASATLQYPLATVTASGAQHLVEPTVAFAWSDASGITPPNEDSTRAELDAYIWQAADPTESRPNAVSEWTLDSRVQVAPAWEVRLNTRYDLANDRPARAGIGVAYKNECVTVDLSAYPHTVWPTDRHHRRRCRPCDCAIAIRWCPARGSAVRNHHRSPAAACRPSHGHRAPYQPAAVHVSIRGAGAPRFCPAKPQQWRAIGLVTDHELPAATAQYYP